MILPKDWLNITWWEVNLQHLLANTSVTTFCITKVTSMLKMQLQGKKKSRNGEERKRTHSLLILILTGNFLIMKFWPGRHVSNSIERISNTVRSINFQKFAVIKISHHHACILISSPRRWDSGFYRNLQVVRNDSCVCDERAFANTWLCPPVPRAGVTPNLVGNFR